VQSEVAITHYAYIVKAQKFNNLTDDDDELEEDNLLDTAIERLEPYGMFKVTLLRRCSCYASFSKMTNNITDLQQSQPQLYESLTKNLNAEEQSIIQGVINQADAIEHQAAVAIEQQQTISQANGQSSAMPSAAPNPQ
jgi:importin-7